MTNGSLIGGQCGTQACSTFDNLEKEQMRSQIHWLQQRLHAQAKVIQALRLPQAEWEQRGVLKHPARN